MTSSQRPHEHRASGEGEGASGQAEGVSGQGEAAQRRGHDAPGAPADVTPDAPASSSELDDVVARVLARVSRHSSPQIFHDDDAAARDSAAAADPHADPGHGLDPDENERPERDGQTGRPRSLGRARELLEHAPDSAADGDQDDLAERHALRRVAGLSTELEDVTEVEYRQLRLERVVLAGLYSSGTLADAENSLRELAALAETAGSQVLDGLLQRRVTPDPGTYLGSGKALELKDVVAVHGADTVIVDAELAPSQRRALEDVVRVKVIDRTGLILDIFAQHAKSKEGKAQVELAQLEYMLPRLRGWGESLSRQAGGRAASGEGIGSRGPGETKIELDRRRIRQRMAKLRREIAGMKPARETKRLNRKRNAVPSVAIAGYTNAGKSSLLNRLTDAGVLVENALFATLDPTVRKTQTPDGIGYTLSDTVGFVRSLPTQLVEAFRSTLEEVADADVIVHVVDASHPDPEGQLKAVRDVLTDVEAQHIPEVVALNKADIADPVVLSRLLNRERLAVAVSARTGQGIQQLRALISRTIPRPDHELEVLIPYVHGELVSRLHRHDAEILRTEHTESGTRLSVRVRENLLAELEPYRITDHGSQDRASGSDPSGENSPA